MADGWLPMHRHHGVPYCRCAATSAGRRTVVVSAKQDMVVVRRNCCTGGCCPRASPGANTFWLLLLLVMLMCGSVRGQLDTNSPNTSGSRCYDEHGKPQRCIPEFVNAAFNVLVDATNTCGREGPQEYCIQTGASGPRKSCEICDDTIPGLQHPPTYLTDFNNNENQTWWQSETMLEGVQYPNQVNLTLGLKKAFDITYVRLKFYSPRPESFAIYKRTSQDGPWIPYQYYSATCRDTYSLPDGIYLRPGEETRALCTSEFSDISPLTGGNVAFSTLEGRPSAYNFENSKELQEWVTATDIRVTLDRINTFGDEVFGDPKVLESYFYAVSDFAVGGRCKCNGHASECVPSTSHYGQSRLVCRCEHNTGGPDCNECLPFYNDVPWGRATSDNTHECKPCNCNNFSNRCFFDQELYDRTGHGGHCLDCAGHRDGPNCERCKENFYQRFDGVCIRCDCSETGSRSLQCNSEGRCQCKPGVTGDKCDRCEVNYYDFGNHGCHPCGCNSAGSLGNELNCDPVTGLCQCKENVEGQRCEQCKPGYFQLDLDNEFGCTPCFCFGHSSVCRAAPGYAKFAIESIFARGMEKWGAEEYTGRSISMQYNQLTQNIGVTAPGRDAVYFVAPERFLGDKRGSYNQDLVFTLRIGENGPRATVEDVILEGAGLVVSQPIFGQGNPLPTIQNQEYRFRLHENADFGWSPRLSARDFITVLSNLTALKIRGTYTLRGVGFLDDVKLEGASRNSPGPPANNIETCTCPAGYIGQFCESCQSGFTHDPPKGGPFARCVACSCNNHTNQCDQEDGKCRCQHNTDGVNCERCARGYYGNALQGTPHDCKPCGCPGDGACLELADDTIICLECPIGRSGPRCELCADGFYEAPEGCLPCDCNDNVDPNAVGNCNRTTGECIKCIYNTGGPQCDQCLAGFYGNALAIQKGDCKHCQCYYAGTVVFENGVPSCSQITGQCECKPYVTGLNCDRCENGFYDIISGDGCSPCNCNAMGASNRTCDVVTGQCSCREGVVGKQCDECAVNHFGFSVEGCKPCECDPIGSLSLQCDAFGQCPCRENVEGLHCDRCKENKYNRHAGCVDCPPCYNLVQDAVSIHRAKLSELKQLLDDIANAPTVIDDLDFGNKLEEVQERVDALWKQAKSATGGTEDRSLVDRLEDMRKRLQEVERAAVDLRGNLTQCEEDLVQGEVDVSAAEEGIERARESIRNSARYLETDGGDALQKAMERSEKFGQQSEQMSNIARESRKIAERLEKEAEDMEMVAQEALNTSTKAYHLAQDAITQQRNVTDEIRYLEEDISQTEDAMTDALQLAAAAQREASAALNDSIANYQEAFALTIPPLNTLSIKQEAQKVEEDSEQLREDAEKLLSDHADLLDAINDQTRDAEILLQRGIAQQQVADELLADAHSALQKAEAAVELGNQTLEEAQKTYATLQGFGQQVNESRGRAEEALKGVHDIEDLIEEAEERTRNAVRGLEEAEIVATEARDAAKEAEGMAEEAASAAATIKEEATETKVKAGELRDDATVLMNAMAEITQNLAEEEGKAERDEATVHESLTKANEAKVKATDASKKVQEALAAVNEILEQLNNTKEVSSDELNALEQRLAAAEADFQASELEKRLAELGATRVLQKQSLKNYEEELEKLRIEVDNIEDIRNELPDGCWKRVKLEP